MQVEYSKTHDMLTGLFNEEYMESLIESKSLLGHDIMSVAVINIDGYKFIRESFGYDYAKGIIQYVAELLKNEMPVNIFQTNREGK